ncbi:S-layer homology domain-containing protein [Lysinibacillus endophyticus]|uniref:S-layer homology domain-containing protein n=1 Tax=Ureibacillus endophyticus TaxID=1978490 RepID=UPI00209E0CC9|nr:S-layer homology domain-containing protein [Lysinibacillus endophyticus]MCP1144979.1 S-layer homology domain-containing protein [Lysinibacillus endophyticus]
MKLVRILFILILSFGIFSVSPAFAADKSIDQYFMEDVYEDHEAYNQLERFLYTDIIEGYEETEVYEEDGEIYEYTSILVKPGNTITRAQFTKILVNAMNLKPGDITKSFPDVKSSDWYYDYVQTATSNGIIIGKPDGKFKPNEKITRAQMASMIYRAFEPTVDFSAPMKTFKDVTTKNSAHEAIAKAAGVGIIKGYGTEFKPNDFAKRSQAVLMIDRALHLELGTAEDESVVTQVVNSNITEEFLLTDQQDINGLKTLYRKTTMGYYLALSLDTLTLQEDSEEFEGTITAKQVGEHTSTVTTLNKRFAEVKIDNLKVQVVMTAPDMNFDMTVDMSGTAYLKKTADDTWKIYNIVYDEDYEDVLSAAVLENE